MHSLSSEHNTPSETHQEYRAAFILISITVLDEVAILGCENSARLCDGITPSISSIRLPDHRIGHEAAQADCHLRRAEHYIQGHVDEKIDVQL